MGLLNDKSLADIENPRLLMLKEKTLWFSFDVIWIAGSKQNGPDYMSRLADSAKKEARLSCLMGFISTLSTQEQDNVCLNEINIVDSIVSSLSENDVRAVTFDQVKQEALNDQEIQDLVDAIENKAGQDTFPDTVSQYQRYRDKLLVLDGVPMYGRRIIVPRSLRREVLESLHSAHQCPSKMIERAKQSVYWPGIMTDIEETRKSCSHCDRNAPSQRIVSTEF